MPSVKSREFRLRQRPAGMPTLDTFELATVTLEPPAEGEFLVRNTWMSVDPYMRGRMVDRRSYVPPFQVGQPLDGGCVGEVIESRHPQFAIGDQVLGMLGWREYWTSNGRGVEKLDPGLAPVQSFLGILGMPGMTAYAGLTRVGRLRDGETVFVSGAAGAVGSVVCQIAKARGCRVIGSAGSADKVAWLRDEAGVDHAFNYKEQADVPKVVGQLLQAAPEGVDLYFENVGGPQLEAALAAMKDFGRVVICGLISQYNSSDPEPGPASFPMILLRRLRVEGFIVTDHLDLRPQFYQDMSQWIGAGKIKWQETIVEGFENAPSAFLGLFSGQNLGKMLVRLG